MKHIVWLSNRAPVKMDEFLFGPVGKDVTLLIQAVVSAVTSDGIRLSVFDASAMHSVDVGLPADLRFEGHAAMTLPDDLQKGDRLCINGIFELTDPEGGQVWLAPRRSLSLWPLDPSDPSDDGIMRVR